ncbi:MAG: GDSL-type esterase/lipase family protein [Planctomycetota bacterium]|nr:GDSL-type esterase/lipase family protein [Planctomycetota bacterium]
MHRLLHVVPLIALVFALTGCRGPATTVASTPSSPPPVAPVSTEPWYEPEIRAFEAQDRAMPRRADRVLFIGSSSIRKWTSLEADLWPVPVLNRGFGGSKTQDVLVVFDRIVPSHRPGVIVYYCGENDLGLDGADVHAAAEGFFGFARRARELRPDVHVFYISIKPSLQRWKNWPAIQRTNDLVRTFCEMTPGMTFVDVEGAMLGADSKPDPSLFVEDGLHMNAKGYERWTRAIRQQVWAAWVQAAP